MDTAPTHFNCKVYPLSRDEQEAENKFINENLEKGYIAPSDSPYGFSTFMVPKKDSKEKRYIINYHPLNAVTRKDVTPLPNLKQCIENLQGMELFSKFDIRWDITTSAYGKAINGRPHSKHVGDYLNPK